MIPARGGSKGIPGKNLVPLGGKPLIAWTIEAAQKCYGGNATVVVSSDDPAIRSVASSYGADVLERPAHLARDESPIATVEQHALAAYCYIDVFVRLQPTSPFRAFYDIDAALSLAHKHGRVVSVTKCREHPYLIKNDRWQDIVRGADKRRLAPRQEYGSYYWINGAIYAARTGAYGDWYDADGTVPYVMPRERSIDIDDFTDLRLAEAMLGRV